MNIRPALLVALSACALGAQATTCANGANNFPACTLPAAPPSGSSSSATGGNATQGQSQRQGQTSRNDNAITNTTDNGSMSYRALAIGFPPPAWTVVPQANGCIVTESDSSQLGWNFAGRSHSWQTSEQVCSYMQMSLAAWDHCQFATASTLRIFAVEKLAGRTDHGLAVPAGERDLLAEDCLVLKNKQPVIVEKPVVKTVIKRVYRDRPTACAAVQCVLRRPS